MSNEIKQITNTELVNELSSRGFYVSEVCLTDKNITDFIVVSVSEFKPFIVASSHIKVDITYKTNYLDVCEND